MESTTINEKKVLNEIVEEINNLTNSLSEHKGLDRSKLSDGYHTFEELYEHRNLLFIVLTKSISDSRKYKFKKNHDGSEYEGWFGVCILIDTDEFETEQISYHLPMKYWDMVNAVDVGINKYYDGHSSKDVIERLIKHIKNAV